MYWIACPFSLALTLIHRHSGFQIEIRRCFIGRKIRGVSLGEVGVVEKAKGNRVIFTILQNSHLLYLGWYL
ncbi:hypothetical protein BofuT4_uP086610.1 [Botrytis cinerea T4]|uniref:Uncharacterized protein n=1 Tax=Botryotinia fuckeliana (strain T4) TaxID=999810 RepID=G2YGI4_BOTF4|nr:hypothetical protein BofuT4_uP086610.1 [Botrytis cinerea T4]